MKDNSTVIIIVAVVAVIGLYLYSQSSKASATAAATAAAATAAATAATNLKIANDNLAATQSNNSLLGIGADLADNLDLSDLLS